MAEQSFFLSHSGGDDDVVRALRSALAELDAAVAIDSREFHGGDPLEGTIRRAVGRSSGVLVLVSPHAHASAWVAKELKHALAVQRERGGHEAFPVVPLLLDGTPLGAFAVLFDDEPIHVPVRSAELDAALHQILIALRLRWPTDAAPAVQPLPEPVEELLLELADPQTVIHADGHRRVRAHARLVHVPAAPGQREVRSVRFALEAPLGVIEADDLRWYLEDYAGWPSALLAGRAQRVEAALEQWGRSLHDAAWPLQWAAEVLKSWAAIGPAQAARRFSVQIDTAPIAGALDDEALAMREAGTLLLGLPWELLHDGRSFLFQGAQPVRVRRRLPNDHAVPVPVQATPVRVLLVSPRPEDVACSYIDHRASADPLVAAMEALAGQVELRLLAPPTLAALRDELDRARRAGQPYHVLHFDGHGVYDRLAGLGALCFEHEEDGQLARGQRRHVNVGTPELGALLRDHGIALVFLEACQTAQAESANESVASALLKTGVGSVVAMSHSVLVETSRRFVDAFYRALCRGERVGGAMLAGQRALKDSPVRGRVFGHGEFRLQDWFVPVLYQDRDDPQLFRQVAAAQTVEDWRARLHRRLGMLPPPPAQGFVGRSRELLALERLLAIERYAVLRGQGGEGKTALAAEFARWRVRSCQVPRAAFVSVEQHCHAQAVLDAIGRQLVGAGYSVAAHTDPAAALGPVLRELRERATLLVIDNLESVLPSPDAPANDALVADDRERADAILLLAAQLLGAGDTRLVFTSREALPAPFDGERQRIELQRLDREDAVQLLERTLGLDAAGQGHEAEAKREDIESLVDAVHGHARTLALLAPALRVHGPAAVQADLVGLMAEMERRFPGQREQSLLASVELSLRRLAPQLRERVQVLGVFHGVVDLEMLRQMMGWGQVEAQMVGDALLDTGLAMRSFGDRNLRLTPGLCSYLAAQLHSADHDALVVRWLNAMRNHVGLLDSQQNQDSASAAAMTLVEVPNLMALLDQVECAGDAEATILLTTKLYELLRNLDRPRLLARIEQARDMATESLGDAIWTHALFEAERTRVEAYLAEGRFREGVEAAERLHERARQAGSSAYIYADFDVAMANFLLGRALKSDTRAESALPLLEAARSGFATIRAEGVERIAARMATVAVSDGADALCQLGRYPEAAQAYERVIGLAKQLGDTRHLAVNLGQLGSVQLKLGRLHQALATFFDARDRFTVLNDFGSVAIAWHQIGLTHRHLKNGRAAENAYRQALAIKVRRNDVAGQANTLCALGNLYTYLLGRPEDAVDLYRRAIALKVERQDEAGEGLARCNLAETMRRLGRLAEARGEIERALACFDGAGHAAEPWKAWAALSRIEGDDGRAPEAGRARAQARDAFLAYRRDGGNSFGLAAQVTAKVGHLLITGDPLAARALLKRPPGTPDPDASLLAVLAALQATIAGQRSPTIADAPELDYCAAAEIVMLLDALHAAGR